MALFELLASYSLFISSCFASHSKCKERHRENHTTQDVLVSMIDEWRKALDEDKLVGSVMLDLSKAFDYSILLQKLRWYGVRGDELKWF